MINSNMNIFAVLLMIASAILIGNLIRLFNCTRATWAATKVPVERFKAAVLLLIYVAITGVFLYCACVTICDVYCPLFD